MLARGLTNSAVLRTICLDRQGVLGRSKGAARFLIHQFAADSTLQSEGSRSSLTHLLALRCFFAVFVMGVTSSSALADIPFVGQWIGKGTAVSEGKPSDVRCRLTIGMPASDRLDLRGRCAAVVGAEDLDFSMMLNSDGTVSTLGEGGEQGPVLKGSWEPTQISVEGSTPEGFVRLSLQSLTADSFGFSVKLGEAKSTDGLEVLFRR